MGDILIRFIGRSVSVAVLAALTLIVTLGATVTAAAKADRPTVTAAPSLLRVDAATANTVDVQLDRSQRAQAAAARANTRVTAQQQWALQDQAAAEARIQSEPRQRAAASRSSRSEARITNVSATDRARAVISFALAQVGKQYRWGAAGPNAYDCSGLVMAAYARVGIKLPHQSGAMRAYGRAVPRGQWQPGDILLYSGHVAIYLGDGRMVHAANPRADILVAKVYGSPAARRLL